MTERQHSPIRDTDDEARKLARSLIADARTAALGVLHPDTGLPHVTRIAVAPDLSGAPMSLISDLSFHTAALKANPECSLLLGEPGAKGDPLNQPRLSAQCTAQFVTRDNPDVFADLQARYLSLIPKAKIYADFLDFSFVRFGLVSGSLNGGFGKAFELSAADLQRDADGLQ